MANDLHLQIRSGFEIMDSDGRKNCNDSKLSISHSVKYDIFGQQSTISYYIDKSPNESNSNH